tara:strand:- start:135 stop:299 length:165 start_codon:yes stop_codon:yes gene_type:complete
MTNEGARETKHEVSETTEALLIVRCTAEASRGSDRTPTDVTEPDAESGTVLVYT